MKAGVSCRDITPPTRTTLADHIRYSTGVHDPLFAKALVLDDGENPVAIVSADLCGGEPDFHSKAGDCVREQTGIEHTLINFTHTHSAPGAASVPGDDDEPHEREWIERLNATIPEIVVEAYANCLPVSLHAGRAPVQVGFNRRLADENGVVVMAVNEAGSVVPWVNVLEVRREDGSPLVILFEHAAHPVIVHGSSSLTGADYPGFAVQRIKEELGNDVTPIFAQGCGANINGFPLKGGWDKAEKAGRKLGDAVLKALETTTEIKADKLVARSTEITLPTEPLPTMEEWREASRDLKIFDLHGFRDRADQLEAIKKTIERGEQPELPLQINAVMLGTEWCLVTLQYEMFCEYELWVDENAPFDHTMTFAYTNGEKTYVAIDEELARGEKGGYEAGSFPSLWAHNVRSLHTSLAVGIEGMIKDGIASLWED